MEIQRIGVAGDAEPCAAPKQHDPLIRVLVEPLSRRRHVPRRHDALDPDAGRGGQNVDVLGGETLGKVVEDVVQVVRIASRLVTSG
jgi:hypothetical protein